MTLKNQPPIINHESKILNKVFKNLSLIVATDIENGIGKNNQLLWHLPEDLKFFKRTTSGHTVIMGRKTFESIGKPLPNRKNIVVSRQENLKLAGIEVYQNLTDAINTCTQEDEVFVIGGGEIYKQALPHVNKIYLTKVNHQFNADTFFPKLEAADWHILSNEVHTADEKHLYNFSFTILVRR